MRGHAVSACLSLGKTATLFSRGAVACCILTNGMYEIPTAPHSCRLSGFTSAFPTGVYWYDYASLFTLLSTFLSDFKLRPI